MVLKFLIQEFPTLKLFIKGESIEYTGERSESEFINWMRRQSRPLIKNLKIAKEVKKFQLDNDIVLIYFGSDKDDIAEFTKVARKNENFPFAIIESEDIIKKFTKPKTIVLFKNFDEKRNELVDIKEIFINEFIEKYTSPKVTKFDDKAAEIIFGKQSPAIMLFASEKSKKWGEYEKILRNVSEKLKGKLKVVLTDIKEGIAVKLANYMVIKENDLPSVRIADTRIRNNYKNIIWKEK